MIQTKNYLRKVEVKQGLGPILRANFDNIIATSLKKDWDYVLLVCGTEGSGKSTVAIKICKYVDPTFTMDRIAYSAKEFRKLLFNSKPMQAILLDEGEYLLYSRDAMTRSNKEITKILQAARHKNQFVAICIPSFKRIDEYVRTDRAHGLLLVTTRGRVKGYSQDEISHAYRDRRTGRLKIPGNPFRDSFGKLTPSEKEAYLKKKESFLFDMLKDEKGTPILEFSKKYGITERTAHNWFNQKKVPGGYDMAGRKRIYEEEFSDYSDFSRLLTRSGEKK